MLSTLYKAIGVTTPNGRKYRYNTENQLVLILEDDENRIAKFETMLKPTFVAENADDMIRHLNTMRDQEISLVCLDHDLGGEIYVDSNNQNTGMEVVRWLEKDFNKTTQLLNIKRFIIHSHNFSAARLMLNRLKSLGYEVLQIPFHNLILKMAS